MQQGDFLGLMGVSEEGVQQLLKDVFSFSQTPEK